MRTETPSRRRRKAFHLDVREPREYQIANLGGHLIPLNDLPKRLNELDPNREIIPTAKWEAAAPKPSTFSASKASKTSAT
jgi:adenylyltransferase/sulfurtransferase